MDTINKILLYKNFNENFHNNIIKTHIIEKGFQNYVINNANQTPEHSLIHGTGHNGGEFLFFPKS